MATVQEWGEHFHPVPILEAGFGTFTPLTGSQSLQEVDFSSYSQHLVNGTQVTGTCIYMCVTCTNMYVCLVPILGFSILVLLLVTGNGERTPYCFQMYGSDQMFQEGLQMCYAMATKLEDYFLQMT